MIVESNLTNPHRTPNSLIVGLKLCRDCHQHQVFHICIHINKLAMHKIRCRHQKVDSNQAVIIHGHAESNSDVASERIQTDLNQQHH